jgi:hypothetical protein
MIKGCDHCCGSGKQITYGGQYNPVVAIDCKHCGGRGWYDPEELVQVPRKFIDKEYWKS